MTLEQQQALAICAMQPYAHEYNRGVLRMLGETALASAHDDAWYLRNQLLEEIADFPDWVARGSEREPSAEQKDIAARYHGAESQLAEAWGTIQTIIDRYRPIAEAVPSAELGAVSAD